MDSNENLYILDRAGFVNFIAYEYAMMIDAFRITDGYSVYEIIVLKHGLIGPTSEPLVRIHSACLTSEVLGSVLCDCALQLRMALELISKSESGLLLYLPWHEGCGNGIIRKIQSFQLIEQGFLYPYCYQRMGINPDKRNYQPILPILRELGLTKVRILTNNPNKVEVFLKTGIKVIESVPCLITSPTKEVQDYLISKKNFIKSEGKIIL